MDDRPSQQTDEEMFRQIFETNFRFVFHFFLNRGISREEAQDLSQETFLRVYRGLAQYRGDVSNRTWLFRIAYNLWLSSVRRRRAEKRHGVEISLAEETGERFPTAGASQENGQEDRLLTEERSRLLHAALADLPTRMRQCVLLRIEGHKYHEIAVIMQSSLDSVKSLLHQSRKRLQEKLGERFPDLEA